MNEKKLLRSIAPLFESIGSMDYNDDGSDQPTRANIDRNRVLGNISIHELMLSDLDGIANFETIWKTAITEFHDANNKDLYGKDWKSYYKYNYDSQDNGAHVRTRVVEYSLSPKSYQRLGNGSNNNELFGDISQLISNLSKTDLSLSALFMAFDLYFRLPPSDIAGLIRVIQLFYGTIDNSQIGPHMRRIIIDVGGRIGYNPVYNRSICLEWLDAVYNEVVSKQPQLYNRVDWTKWFDMMQIGYQSKYITIKEFFA